MSALLALLNVARRLLARGGPTTRPGAIGVTREQRLLVPAETVERMAHARYANRKIRARAAGRLVRSGPEYERLRAIGTRLVAQTTVFRDDSRHWRWQLTLIDAPVMNATCAPGGKITFYTGLLRRLHLTDEEIAAVLGHEIAHALREHGREKVSEAVAAQLARVLCSLPGSREKESEADRIGLELMARAGYDPQGAVTLWRKIAARQRRKKPEFLSTHPSPATRIQELRALLVTVWPLYEAAPKP